MNYKKSDLVKNKQLENEDNLDNNTAVVEAETNLFLNKLGSVTHTARICSLYFLQESYEKSKKVACTLRTLLDNPYQH